MAGNAPYFQTFFSIREFAERRKRLAAEIGSGALAVLKGAPETGAFELFRQTNEFFYLCGIETPHACLMIEGGSGAAKLYLPRHDPKHERSEGAVLHADDPALVREITGVENAKPLDALAADVALAAAVYTPFEPGEGFRVCRDTARHARKMSAADPWDRRESEEERFRAALQRAAPKAEVRDLSPFLDQLRVVKSPREIEAMRFAGRLSAMSVAEAMRGTRPGRMEFHLAAVAEFIFALNGARGGSYRPIVAGGANIWNAHYYRNNCPLRDGDLVLMDYAPDFCCYTSDIGRIWPVNGKYAPWQRELCVFVTDYHQMLLPRIRPGVTAAQVMEETAAEMLPRVEKTRWSKLSHERAAREMLKFKGHLSHGVGMAVHDAGDYRKGVLAPGMVFAVDPQLWAPEEQLYIRVEDTVAVTGAGSENLTALAPLELDDIEAAVGQGGILDSLPPLNLQS